MIGATELLIILVILGLGALALFAVLALLRRAARSGGSVEARLRELDDLRARGLISDEEHAAARARALSG